jgi:hypothetical protein
MRIKYIFLLMGYLLHAQQTYTYVFYAEGTGFVPIPEHNLELEWSWLSTVSETPTFSFISDFTVLNTRARDSKPLRELNNDELDELAFTEAPSVSFLVLPVQASSRLSQDLKSTTLLNFGLFKGGVALSPSTMSGIAGFSWISFHEFFSVEADGLGEFSQQLVLFETKFALIFLWDWITFLSSVSTNEKFNFSYKAGVFHRSDLWGIGMISTPQPQSVFPIRVVSRLGSMTQLQIEGNVVSEFKDFLTLDFFSLSMRQMPFSFFEYALTYSLSPLEEIHRFEPQVIFHQLGFGVIQSKFGVVLSKGVRDVQIGLQWTLETWMISFEITSLTNLSFSVEVLKTW